MKKWMLILGGLAALVIGAGAALLVSINPIVEAGVNKYGPDITGTHVFLKKADISVFSGKGSLHEFSVGNPKGYSALHAVKIGSLSIELDKDSLLEDVIIIKKIAIDSPDIVYEIGKKSTNFDDIIKNVEQSVGAAEKAEKAPAKPAKDEGTPKKVVIDELVITNGKAAIAMPLLKLNLTAPLPDIRLTDIGREKSGKQGVSMAEATKRVLKSMSSSLGKVSKNAASGAAVQLKAGAEVLQKSAKEAADKAQAAIQKTGESIDKSIKDSADKLKEGLGGLFKKQ